MSISVLYRPEPATLTGLRTAIQAAVQPASTAIRCDIDVIQGDVASPMVLLEHASTTVERPTQSMHDVLVYVEARATFIADAVSLARECRARAFAALFGRDAHGWLAPLTVTGFAVIDRGTENATLPAADIAGGWSNAVLPVRVCLQPTS